MANKEKMGPPTLEMIQGNPYNYTFDEVAKCMGEERAKSLFKTLYKNGVSPKNQTMTIKDIYVGGDTTKYAFELQDGYCIETVCIKRRTGNTVCVSTMVGCPVGCIFCASGKNGFIRNLSPAEIVQQIVLLKERVNRIVFMGMGEPLFNYDNKVVQFSLLGHGDIQRILDPGAVDGDFSPIQKQQLHTSGIHVERTGSCVVLHNLASFLPYGTLTVVCRAFL